MFSHLLSRRARTKNAGNRRRRLSSLRVESLEDRRLLNAGSFLHGGPMWWGPIASLMNQAAATATTHAASTTVSSSTAATTTATAAATTTALAVSPGTSTYGQHVTLSATVATTGTGTPAGKVQFYDGGTAIGTAKLNSSGVATFDVSNLSVGTHTITATYLGNTNFATSTSDTPTSPNLTVSAANTYTVLSTSSNPIGSNDTLTLTARVSGDPTGNGSTSNGLCGLGGGFGSQASLPSGTVDFQATESSGTVTDLGSALVTGGVARLSLSSSTLTAGDYTVVAIFTPSTGSTNYVGSTSLPVTQSVSDTLTATKIRVSMSPRHGLTAGDSVTYSVTVQSVDSTSIAVPSGTVTFVDAVTGTPLAGSPVTLDASGKATLTTTYTTDPIIVTYTPDDNTTTGSSVYASSQTTLSGTGSGFGRGHDHGFGGGGIGSRFDAALMSLLGNLRGFGRF